MIVVLVETNADGVEEISLETIALARSLSEAGGGIAIRAAVVGELSDDVTAELGKHGVAEVHHVSGPAFTSYAAAAWAAAVQEVQRETKSVVVTAAGSERGNEVLAHVAARTGCPMAANVVSFTGLAPFVVTRQVVGGAALEEMKLDQRPAVFTVAGHSWTASPAEQAGSATVVEHTREIADADLVARVVEVAAKEPDASGSLKSARVVVGAGRGAGGPEGFDGVIELADLLDGQLGVSRVVTSLGWRPHHEQVGQTGSRIAPELYVPCGISGAIQHWAGCSSSKVIVAINTDDEAPMVTRADYAVIGDMHEIVPAVNEEIRRRRA